MEVKITFNKFKCKLILYTAITSNGDSRTVFGKGDR